MTHVDIDSLPESIRTQIEALNKPKKEMFPILPREYSTDNFQTKEIKELGLKMDEVIVAVNELHKIVTTKPEKGVK